MSIRMAKIQKVTTPNAGEHEHLEQQNSLIHCSQECKMVQPFWKMAVSYETTLIMQCNIYAPWNLPKGTKNLCPHKNLHIDVHSSFIHNSKTWKQPRRPSVSKWVNELWCIRTKEYLALKKKELSSHEKT